jgi:hypothetical protein
MMIIDDDHHDDDDLAGGTSIWGMFYVSSIGIDERGVKQWGPDTRFGLNLD